MTYMKKIIDELINNAIEGVDVYFHNGSMWLIFTERKEWVIELTENGTLWYNYDFFKNLFNYASLGVIENQHYITMWVEDILQNGVKNTFRVDYHFLNPVEDILQNGVKNTRWQWLKKYVQVEDILQNGVKNTRRTAFANHELVEDILQNGVKSISQISREPVRQVEDVIQNGVKDTMRKSYFDESMVEDTIQNGDLICKN